MKSVLIRHFTTSWEIYSTLCYHWSFLVSLFTSIELDKHCQSPGSSSPSHTGEATTGNRDRLNDLLVVPTS